MTRIYRPDRFCQPSNNNSLSVDRATLLAMWLLENADQVNSSENVKIVFNCAGKKASVEMTERHKIDHTSLSEHDLSDIITS